MDHVWGEGTRSCDHRCKRETCSVEMALARCPAGHLPAPAPPLLRVLTVLSLWAVAALWAAGQDTMVVRPREIDDVLVNPGIARVIAQLDAEQFEARDQATRQLMAAGPSAIPLLVQALGEGSRELRFRASLLLIHYPSFEEVAPHLVAAIEKPHAMGARTVLCEQAWRQIDAACQPAHAATLFKLWGTDMDAFRSRVLQRLTDARTRAEAARAAEPLVGLSDQTRRFSHAIDRLESLSIPHAHQYSPGFVIADVLARGLAERRAAWVAFADDYLASLEALVAELRGREAPAHAVRKEVSDRATMSQGAASFLVRVLDEGSPETTLVSRRIGIAPGTLREAFCRGLASPEPREYDRGIGMVHIVDMLTEVLRQWPDAPADGPVQALIARTSHTAAAGDKPKALALLDALEACRDLPQHHLSLREGLGKRLGERLCAAALQAPNHRIYHPARYLHDRLVQLVDLGVPPEHDAFPAALCEAHLRGEEQALGDAQRLALERYLRMIERLQAAGLDLQAPGARRFLRAMKDCLTARHEQLASAAIQLDRLLLAGAPCGGQERARALDRALGDWTAKLASR